jgi:hypothetical protein
MACVDAPSNITGPEYRVDEVMWVPKEILVDKPHTDAKKRRMNETRSRRSDGVKGADDDETEYVNLRGLVSHVMEDNQCCEKIDQILLEPLTRWLQSLCDESNENTTSSAKQQTKEAAPLHKDGSQRTPKHDRMMVSMQSKRRARNDRGNNVRVALRRDIFKILEKAGMTMPSSTSNTDPVVMLPYWIYDEDDDDTDGSDDDNDDVGSCKTETNLNQQTFNMDNFKKGRSKTKHPEQTEKVSDPHPKMENNNHSRDSVVHVAQKVAKATSSKYVESASTTADSEENNGAPAEEPLQKKYCLGLSVALLVAISILFVAGASFRQYHEAKEFRSSQVYAAIENDDVDDDQFQGFDPESYNDDGTNGADYSPTLTPSVTGPVDQETTTWPTEDGNNNVGEESPAPSPNPTNPPPKDNVADETPAPSPNLTNEPPENIFAEKSPAPSPNPTNAPPEIKTVIFAAIGDVPYTDWEAKKLKTQMDELDETAEFVIHVGDIRSAATRNDCYLSEFENVAEILLRSRVPVFIIPGDNDW